MTRTECEKKEKLQFRMISKWMNVFRHIEKIELWSVRSLFHETWMKSALTQTKIHIQWWIQSFATLMFILFVCFIYLCVCFFSCFRSLLSLAKWPNFWTTFQNACFNCAHRHKCGGIAWHRIEQNWKQIFIINSNSDTHTCA